MMNEYNKPIVVIKVCVLCDKCRKVIIVELDERLNEHMDSPEDVIAYCNSCIDTVH